MATFLQCARLLLLQFSATVNSEVVEAERALAKVNEAHFTAGDVARRDFGDFHSVGKEHSTVALLFRRETHNDTWSVSLNGFDQK